MDLLTLFALPIATIILAFAVEKILRIPILTAATFFAIYLILSFTVFDTSFLVYAIIYTLLAYIAALIAEYIYTNCKIKRLCCNSNNTDTSNCNCSNSNNTSSNTDNLIVAGITDEEIDRIAQRVVGMIMNSNSCRRR